MRGGLLRRSLALLLACVIAGGCVPLASFSFLSDQAFAEESAGDGGAGDAGSGDAGSGETGGGSGESGGSGTGGETGGTGGGETGGGSGTGGESGGGGSGGESGGSGGDQPSTAPKIRDAGIHLEQSNQYLGYATNPNLIQQEIRTKGGTLELQCDVWWTGGSSGAAEPAGHYVTWSTSDQAVATINSTGILTARSNGTVEVLATIAGANTTTGSDLVAKITVVVMGQTDDQYVTGIRIMAPDGSEVGPSAYVVEGDISYTSIHFYAAVDVYDPITQATATYYTSNGSLSSQTQFSDPTWSVDPAEIGAVDEKTGQYRALQYGTVFLTVTSLAGFNNERVTCTVGVTAQDPDGGAVDDNYAPQNTLSIKAYYELYPPADLNDDNDPNFVINKEYSVAALEALGTTVATYTALGTPNYYTLTGYGVYLANVLSDSGANMSGIKGFHFGTQDNVKTTISYSSLYATRYYYPNIDIGSYGGAVQVAPMLAIESCEVRNASTDPDYENMSEATRFRLLMGSTSGGGNAQFQIKWINTMYVVLSGGPATSDGDGNGGSGGTGGGGDTTGSGTDGTGSGSGESGVGPAAGSTQGTTGGDSTTLQTSESNNHTDAAEGASGASAGDTAGSSDGSGQHLTADAQQQPPAFSVYQVMNANDSATTTTITRDNPLRAVALPAGVALLVVGGLESFVWYRRQTRGVPTPA